MRCSKTTGLLTVIAAVTLSIDAHLPTRLGLAIGGIGGQTAVAGERISSLVYSCTGGTEAYAPGQGVYVADDMRTTEPCGCTATSYTVGVDGQGDGSGVFSAQVALLDACPDDGGEVIDGTSAAFSGINDGAPTVLTVDLSSAPVPVPRTPWLRIRFNNYTAGVVVGEAAELGFSIDGYWHPAGGCNAGFPGDIYAAFYGQVYCEEAEPPPAAGNPNPGDGVGDVRLYADLSWDVPVTRVTESGLNGQLNPEPPETEPPAWPILNSENWPRNVGGGKWCATQEIYDAKLAASGRAPVAGCPLDGTCDKPLVRDAFTPEPDTLIKTFRTSLHVFCYSDGSGCVSNQSEVDNQMALVNQRYEPYRIQFTYETEFINDTTFRDLNPAEEAGTMKLLYVDSPDTKLNIFVVNVEGSFSYGTFPWDPDALTAYGGIVMHDPMFGSISTTLVHEMGHNLGLWHTFHGVDEVDECGACYERAQVPDQDNEGDRCSDTPPTPTNYSCGDPGGTDPCNGHPWGATDYQNYMSYAPSSCRTHYTTQQSGRMHCWIEDVLTGWMEDQCAAEYDVYLDTTNPPTTLVCEGVTDPTCDPGLLDCDTTHYWQVVTTQVGLSTPGPVWSFTTVGGGDCNSNGTPDECELDLGMTPDCNNNGIPDECDVPPINPAGNDCNANGIPDECEVPPIDPAGDDCNDNGTPDECEVPPIDPGAEDCNTNGIPDECEVPPIDPGADDCNTNGIPDECEADCQPNGVPDDCDIDDATSVDCQPNGIPDECDLRDCAADPACDDCNNNDIPDACDIATGTSLDNNGNGVPDDCEVDPPAPEPGPSCTVPGDCTGAYDGADCVGGMCYVPKNRYLSIDPTVNLGPVAYQVEITESAPYGGALGRTWWVDEPLCYDFPNGDVVVPAPPTCEGEDRFGWVAMLTAAPATRVWTESMVHITGCGIAPEVTFEIRASHDSGVSFSEPLQINTAHNPDSVSQSWGDITGGPVEEMPGVWLPPDRSTNFADVGNSIRTFENRTEDTGHPPRIWVDVEINQVINLADIQFIVGAFEGTAYVDLNLPLIGIDPAACP